VLDVSMTTSVGAAMQIGAMAGVEKRRYIECWCGDSAKTSSRRHYNELDRAA
jgi:hypothetical protein